MCFTVGHIQDEHASVSSFSDKYSAWFGASNDKVAWNFPQRICLV